MADLTVDLGVNAGNSESTLNGVSQSLDGVTAGAAGASAALANVGGIAQTTSDLWNTAERRADELSRAQNDVTQASLDMEQATRDAAQAQIDINQAQRDGAQAGIDLEQALLDQKTAQQAYNETVAEYGAGSLEAQQATIDLKQADEDARQAKMDSTQATEDLRQAQLDGKQATLDGKNAQLDLNEAQRNTVGPEVMGSWIGTASTVASALFGLLGTFSLLQGGMLTTALASVTAAATTVGSWIAMAATSTVSALAVAGAWLLSIWPIALVIAAVVGLTILIIKNWDTIVNALSSGWNWVVRNVFNPIGSFFTRIIPGWVESGTRWIRDKWSSLISWFAGVPGMLARGASGMWGFITNGLQGAINSAIGIINNGIYFINANLIANANRIPGVDIPWIPYIPFLEDGGVTTGPTMAMIGEGSEQEAVLPLSKLQGLLDMDGGGGRPIVLQINGSGFREYLQENVRVVSGGDIVKYAGGA